MTMMMDRPLTTHKQNLEEKEEHVIHRTERTAENACMTAGTVSKFARKLFETVQGQERERDLQSRRGSSKLPKLPKTHLESMIIHN